ncbi:MAG: hydroxysqualene dehydroxylase HpnE [Noviherbaspirillum sp.]
MTFAARKIAVIGAGWAGCAAAMELARRGHAVTLLEASRTLGGRARRVEVDGRPLDNGQHILLGAYRESLRLMRLAGMDTGAALLRLPLQIRYPEGSGGMDFAAARLPAPWHMAAGLLRARGLERADKLALARFSTTARWIGWRLDTDCTVADMLERYDQPERLVRLMWRPLCIAALNTVPERASAQVFLNVLRDSLGANRAASDMLVPRTDLSALFPEQAARYVRGHGGSVRCGAAVTGLSEDGAGWQLEIAGQPEAEACDRVVLAVHPGQVARLAGGFWQNGRLPALEHEPITTCYLQYAPSLRLQRPMFALLEDPVRQAYGQFVFDRGHLVPAEAGLLAVVVSTAEAALAAGHEALGRALAAQLAQAFGAPALEQPQWTRLISEKRATFSCTPALRRPPNASGVPGLAIAGDYTEGDYPATLEGAVRSGIAAARLVNEG